MVREVERQGWYIKGTHGQDVCVVTLQQQPEEEDRAGPQIGGGADPQVLEEENLETVSVMVYLRLFLV